MTISDTVTKYRYEGNASTDTFAFPAKAFTSSDLIVEIITRATDALVETLTITTHYTVTIATNGTASITVVPGKIPSALQDIQIRRSLAQTQTVSLPTGTVFPAKVVETAIDRAVGLAQDLEEAVTRSLKFLPTSSTTVATLPEPVDDAVICFDGTTGLFKVGATNTELLEQLTAAAASAAAAASSATAAAASAITAAASAAGSLTQSSKSTAYTTVLSDAGTQILHPATDNNARTFTIDSNANVAYAIGTMITFINLINTLSIGITSDTLYLAGTSTTGTRTLLANGMATALKVGTTTWIIAGTGLT